MKRYVNTFGNAYTFAEGSKARELERMGWKRVDPEAADVAPAANPDDPASMTRTELIDKLREMGVEVSTRANRAELVAKFEEAMK